MVFIKSTLIIIILIFSFITQAQDLGVIIGLRSDSANTNLSGYEINSSQGFNVGLIQRVELAEYIGLRAGMQYVTRQYTLNNLSLNQQASYKFTYFEIPLTIMYFLTEGGGIFLGPSLGFNLDKSCGSFICSNVSNSLTMLQLGASFKFHPQLGLEIFYEQSSTNIENHVREPRAVGLNFFIVFE